MNSMIASCGLNLACVSSFVMGYAVARANYLDKIEVNPAVVYSPLAENDGQPRAINDNNV